MHHVVTKFMPHLLTDKQKENHVTVSQEFFDHFNAVQNVLKNVVTGDEMWVYGYSVEKKNAVIVVYGKIVVTTKKACQNRSNMKVTDVDSFFLIRRASSFIMNLFHMVRQSVMSLLEGSEVFERGLRHGQTRPGCCTMTMDLHTHRFLFVKFWAKHEMIVTPVAILSRFGPCGLLFLFPKLKFTVKGRHFQMVGEIQENSLEYLHTIPQNAFQYAFQNWRKRWQQCVNSGGEYFEEDKLMRL
jgi:hypothetical protein